MTIPTYYNIMRDGPTTVEPFHLECYVLDELQNEMENKYWGGDSSVPGPLLIDMMILGYFTHWWMYETNEFKYYKYRQSISQRWPYPSRYIIDKKTPETFINTHTGILPGELNWVKTINWVPVVNEINRISDEGNKGEVLASQEIWERWDLDFRYNWPGRDRLYSDDLNKLLKERPGWDTLPAYMRI